MMWRDVTVLKNTHDCVLCFGQIFTYMKLFLNRKKYMRRLYERS